MQSRAGFVRQKGRKKVPSKFHLFSYSFFGFVSQRWNLFFRRERRGTK
jgi:hypothetical protein